MGERHATLVPSVSITCLGHRGLLGRETPHEGLVSGWFCLRRRPLLTFFPHPTRVSRGCGSVGRASPCQGEGRGFESRHPLGRLAQRERASLTRKRSLVRSQYRPPDRPGAWRSGPFCARIIGVSVVLQAACCGVVSVRVPGGMCHRNAVIWPLGPGGIRLESGRILDVAPQRSGSAACPDRDVAMTAGNGLSRRALPSGEELVPAARNGWI